MTGELSWELSTRKGVGGNDGRRSLNDIWFLDKQEHKI